MLGLPEVPKGDAPVLPRLLEALEVLVVLEFAGCVGGDVLYGKRHGGQALLVAGDALCTTMYGEAWSLFETPKAIYFVLLLRTGAVKTMNRFSSYECLEERKGSHVAPSSNSASKCLSQIQHDILSLPCYSW